MIVGVLNIFLKSNTRWWTAKLTRGRYLISFNTYLMKPTGHANTVYFSTKLSGCPFSKHTVDMHVLAVFLVRLFMLRHFRGDPLHNILFLRLIINLCFIFSAV